jgi:hypothetical protein
MAKEILAYCELKQHNAGFDKVRSKLLDQENTAMLAQSKPMNSMV